MKSRGAPAAPRASRDVCLRRVRDFAHVDGAKTIDRKVADRALLALEVDAAGLDAMDRALSLDHRVELRRRAGGCRYARGRVVGTA